jgi:hypothetical protein
MIMHFLAREDVALTGTEHVIHGRDDLVREANPPKVDVMKLDMEVEHFLLGCGRPVHASSSRLSDNMTATPVQGGA